MRGKYLRTSAQRWAVGLSTTTVAAALAILPAGAQAVLVKPQPVKPQTVTPHVVTPTTQPTQAPTPSSQGQTHSAPAPSPAPAPSAPPPPPPPPPSGDSGPASDRGAPSDTPAPEGLPDHWDDACDLACKQEWFDWYEDQYRPLRIEIMISGDTAAAKLLRDEIQTIEDEIKALGGTPGEMPGDGPEVSTEPPNPTADRPAEPQPAAIPAPVAIPLPDAITGVGPLISNSRSAITTVIAGAATLGGGITNALVKGLSAILGGSTQTCGKPTIDDRGVTVCPK